MYTICTERLFACNAYSGRYAMHALTPRDASTAYRAVDILIYHWRRKRGLTQQELADRIKADKSTVWRYEKGRVSPFNSTLHDIALALEVKVEDLFPGSGEARLIGDVGAGAVVRPLDDEVEWLASPPGLNEPVALRVVGTSMMPAYKPGDVLFCESVAVNSEALLNHDCVVETEDGRRLVKKVMRGGAPGTVRLFSYETQEAEDDVTLRSAAPIRWVRRS